MIRTEEEQEKDRSFSTKNLQHLESVKTNTCSYGCDMGAKTYFFDHHPQDSRCTYEPETANSVTARYGTGGGNTPIVVEVNDG